MQQKLAESEQRMEARLAALEARQQHSASNAAMLEDRDDKDGFSIAESLGRKIDMLETQLRSLQDGSLSASVSPGSIPSSAGALQRASQMIDPCRRWITGFPRAILKEHRAAHFAQIKLVLPSHLSESATGVFQNSGASYSIKFQTEAHASEFHNWASVNGNLPA